MVLLRNMDYSVFPFFDLSASFQLEWYFLFLTVVEIFYQIINWLLDSFLKRIFIAFAQFGIEILLGFFSDYEMISNSSKIKSNKFFDHN